MDFSGIELLNIYVEINTHVFHFIICLLNKLIQITTPPQIPRGARVAVSLTICSPLHSLTFTSLLSNEAPCSTNCRTLQICVRQSAKSCHNPNFSKLRFWFRVTILAGGNISRPNRNQQNSPNFPWKNENQKSYWVVCFVKMWMQCKNAFNFFS